ncbi:MAG: hypothetical protein ACYCW6_06670 [Candidatus Xenobia bacterium]
MKRKQIYLDTGMEQRLKTVALREGCSEASLVREAIGRLLADRESRVPGDAGSPLLKLIGLAEGARSDSAEHHDKYLYGSDR